MTHKVGEFSMNTWSSKVTGSTGPLTVKKCLRWEERQIVSDEELAAYNHLLATYPDMVRDDYQTHEEVCVERSETEDEVLAVAMPDWFGQLTRYDAPITSLPVKKP